MKKQQIDGNNMLKSYTTIQKNLKNWTEKRRLLRRTGSNSNKVKIWKSVKGTEVKKKKAYGVDKIPVELLQPLDGETKLPYTVLLIIYRVIHKSFRDFRTRLSNNQDRHGRKEHINRQKIYPIFFVLGALAYFQVPPLGDILEEKWRSQRIRKRSVSWNLPKLSQL